MSFDLKSIQRGNINLPPRIALLGTPKVGKTTFACSAPNAILISVKGEEGGDDLVDPTSKKPLDVAKFPDKVQTFSDILTALGTLAQEDHPYETVVIDSSSTLEPLVWDQVCEDTESKSIQTALKGWGKGFVEALYYWRKIQDCLDYLRNNKNMASILIGHVNVKSWTEPGKDPYEKYIWNIHVKAASLFEQWVDCILFAKKISFVQTNEEGGKKLRKAIGDGTRVLCTQDRPTHPGGGRGVYGHLPYELEFTWSAFADAVKEAR